MPHMSSEKEAAEVPSWQQPLDGEWKMLKLWGRSNNILAQPILLLSGGLWEPNQVFPRECQHSGKCRLKSIVCQATVRYGSETKHLLWLQRTSLQGMIQTAQHMRLDRNGD